jgi:hypothetical protein
VLHVFPLDHPRQRLLLVRTQGNTLERGGVLREGKLGPFVARHEVFHLEKRKGGKDANVHQPTFWTGKKMGFRFYVEVCVCVFWGVMEK